MEILGQFRREGLGRRENRRLGLIFLMALSFSMVLFSLFGARASVFEKAREALLDISEPVLSVLGSPIRWVDARFGDLSDYFDVLDENKRLREENTELRAWMHEAITLQRQLEYFRGVLGVELPEPADYVDALVIGEVDTPFQRSMILNAGASQGIENGFAVVQDAGMVGHVVTTGKSASRILLLTDPSSRTPVVVEGAELEAILVGRSRGQPALTFFAIRDPEGLQAGQRVVTSGAGGVLPRGIPIGEVTDISDDGVRVRLFANYAGTDFVRVVKYRFQPDLTPVEQSNDGEAPQENPQADEEGGNE
jgi:rod shape-determining protein MreC